MDLFEAMTSRWSCRAFLDKPVSPADIETILGKARWAPSGVNTQPWQVAVVSGETKQRLTDALIQARDEKIPEQPDYDYYPTEWLAPFKARRLNTGLSLYKALNISKDDPDGRKKAWYNNYRFFGAPVGLFVFIDRSMGQGSWLDTGMFMQNIMLGALAMGLATCPQASLAEYPDRVRDILKVDNDKLLVAGIALGYPDMAHPVNNYRLERVTVEDFTHWYE